MKEALKSLKGTKTGELLLAISGGVDSMVLAHLLKEEGIPYAMAHCHFGLRHEADEELSFVVAQAKELGVRVHTRRFETYSYAKEEKLSIEMAARELRYSWFSQLQLEHGYSYIVLGHHQDDQVETFFLNLNRGAGHRGLSGMKKINGVRMRPLLNTPKAEILAYAKKHEIEYKEDQSNYTTQYDRNKIRNLILPLMEAEFPTIKQGIICSMNHMDQLSQFFTDFIAERFSGEDPKEIKFSKLYMGGKLSGLLLFERIRIYGFAREQIADIVKAIERKSTGAIFLSKTHRLLIDREEARLMQGDDLELEICLIDKETRHITSPLEIKIATKQAKNYVITGDPRQAAIDKSRLEFPLQLRKWKQGDSFYPLGMRGKKKISDFLIDKKVSRFEKEHVFVLTSREDIVWVVGHRIDNRYAISEQTEVILELNLC